MASKAQQEDVMDTRRTACTGVTLVELMMVVAIMAIMQAWAVPSFSSMLHASRTSGATDALHKHLLLARSEAGKRGARVVLCKSASGVSCNSSGGWEQGWVVFHDVNNNAAIDPGETVLGVMQALPESVKVSGNSPLSSYVSYGPSGRVSKTSGGFQAGTLTICSVAGDPVKGRQIVISGTGRVRQQKVELDRC